MPFTKTKLSQPRYNPETGGFEAEARLLEGGKLFTYKLRHNAIPQAGFDRVMRGLMADLTDQHSTAADRATKLATVMARTGRPVSSAQRHARITELGPIATYAAA